MNDLTILFAHTTQDEVTLRHLDIVASLNPGVPVVPVTFARAKSPDGNQAGPPLDGTFDAARLEPRFAGQNRWAGTDCMIYAWYLHARTQATTAERYVFVEWDMLYRVPMRAFYAEVWGRDVACAECLLVDRHWHWNWFRHLGRLPLELHRHAAGIVPIAGTLFSDRVLSAITQCAIPLDVFCELRLGTLIRAAGFDIFRLPYEKGRNITWNQRFLSQVATPAYHPVKTLKHNLE
jgi:hypothetical protein